MEWSGQACLGIWHLSRDLNDEMGLGLRINIQDRGYYKAKDPEEEMSSSKSVLASVLRAKKGIK